MPATILIVADDLTGAADCGITCTLAGLPTVVVAFGDLRRAEELDADVIAFDTDTRRATPEAAAEATAQAVTTLGRAGSTRVVYKKIDSTLRGNFAVEIAAARRAATGIFRQPPMAILAAAFPGTGRTTVHGRMLLAGEPLEHSGVWRNEKITGVADVPALLRSAGGLHAGLVDLQTVRGGTGGLTAALDEHARAGVEAVACDAETEDDLRALAHAAARMRAPVIFAGSAGLMRHLPEAFGLSKTEAAPAPAPVTAGGPLLFIVGSMSEVSREGLRALGAEPGVRVLTLSPATLRDGEGSAAWTETTGAVHAATAAGEDVALALGLEDGVDLSESAALSGALARFVLPLAPGFAGLFLTGGETARALLNAAGAAGIRLVGEVEPGVPMGTAEGWNDLPVITKAGAFGNAGTLVRARAALRGTGS